MSLSEEKIMSLVDFIINGDAKSADHYLRNLAHKSAEDLNNELAMRYDKEMTSLHLAVERSDMPMVKVLLSYGAAVNAKICNINVVDYAKALAENNPANVQQKMIYALIRSRGRWLNDRGISFSRSVKAIEDVTINIRDAKDKVAALFLGVTGEGKSTLINYLCGVDYKRTKVSGVMRVTPLGSEFVRTGHSTTSETVYPEVIESKNQPYVLVDLPGFADTRGAVEEVCAAAGICMLTKQLHSIPAILLVTSWNSLEQPKMLSYRKSAQNIGAMIFLNPAAAENVILIVTKPTDDLKIEDVRARLHELSQGEGWQSISHASNRKRESLTEDQWKRQCLRNATQAILSHKINIILGDVTTPYTRSIFQQAMDKRMKISQTPYLFDFQSSSQYVNDFIAVLKSLCLSYIHTRNEVITLSDSLKILYAELDNLQFQRTSKSKLICDLDKSSSIAFDKTPFEIRVTTAKEQIQQLKNQKSQFLITKISYKTECRHLSRDIVIEESKLAGTRQFLEAEKVRLARNLAFAKNDPNAEVNRAFRDSYFLLDCQSDNIKSMRDSLSSTERKISTCENDVWTIRDQLRQHESLLVNEMRSLHGARTLHEENGLLARKEIQVIQLAIENLQSHIALLTSKKDILFQDFLLRQMELEVNEYLYLIVREIIQVLEIKNDVMDNFMQSFRGNPLSTTSSLSRSLLTFITHAPPILLDNSAPQVSSERSKINEVLFSNK
jgi:GTP-binding protein EngB required for normal cell division